MGIMARVKKEMRGLGVDIMLDLQAHQASHQRAAIVAMAFGTLVGAASPVFAVSDINSMGEKVKEVVSNLYTASCGVVTVLAALMLVFAFIMRMVGSQQTAAKATSWIVRILICYVLYNCIGLFFRVIENTTSGLGWNPQGVDASTSS